MCLNYVTALITLSYKGTLDDKGASTQKIGPA